MDNTQIMNAVIFTEQKKKGMTSLEIAEVTGKQHAHIMRDIRKLLEQGVSQSNFGLSSYQQPQPNGGTKEVPCYKLTPKGCLILASGYDALLREKIINRLEELEKTNKPQVPQTFAQALMLAAKQQEEIEQQKMLLEAKQAQLSEMSDAISKMQPKITYLDTILSSKDTVTVTQIAQDYGLSAKAFNKILANYRVQRKVNGTWIVYAPYLAKGYVQSETFTFTHADGTQGTRLVTKWTQRGRIFLYEELKKKNIIPLIEQK